MSDTPTTTDPAAPPLGSPAPVPPPGTGDASRSDLPDPPTLPAMSDADRTELEQLRTEKADRAEATADHTGDTPPCPGCGTTSLNPAPHERNLAHCWRCGYGSAPGQTYPPESA